MTAEKKQTNKQEAETKYKCSQVKSFSSRLAKPETTPQIKVTIVHVFCQKLVWWDR